MSIRPTPLPSLDGTPKSVVARLDAFSRRFAGAPAEDALNTARSALEEARLLLPELASTEECDNECCSKQGTVEYLVEQIAEARTALAQASAALDDNARDAS